MPIKKEIIYPIFLECCPHAKNSFWENIFEDLAYGKTPYGTYISKDFLCCSYRKKDFSYKIERKKSLQIHNDVYKLLTDKLGLFSPQEKNQHKKDFENLENEMSYSRDNWSSIRKKNIKELLVELFVIRMKNKYSLTLKKSRYLLSVIFMAIIFKVITSDDIKYSDGKIYEIEGIKFSKNKVIIECELYNLDTLSGNRIVSTKKSKMSDNWLKYLKELRN
uniref:Uncharacterized protein n=1 Tax=viral metagenome TaxID=1070528 RepID=A0A6C0LYE6_9ZZZZ